MNEHFTGLLPDNRPATQKEKQFSSLELAGAAGALTWATKEEAKLRAYKIWNQWASSGCVSYATAKRVAIEIYRLTGVWLDLSPASIYQKRVNKNAAGRGSLGMFAYDAEEIIDTLGVTLDALMPSADLSTLTEAQINSIPSNAVADKIAAAIAEAIGAYMQLPMNMDAVGAQLDLGKGVTITLFANFDEYNTAIPTVKYPNLTYADAGVQHRVILTDRNLDPVLGKVFIMEDSWGVGNGMGGRRKVTEDFFYRRVSTPMVQTAFTLNPASTAKPRVHLTKVLVFIPLDAQGNISDTALNAQQLADVQKVQDVLKYEGLFPANVASTGYYGAVTAKAVDAYQRKYKIAPTSELDELQGKQVGKKTIADINTRYA